MKNLILAVILLLLCFPQFVCAQETLAVIPLKGSSVEISTQETVYMLLLSEIRQLKKYNVVPESEILQLLGDGSCSETACAVEIGRQVQASRVVFGSLNKLGEKIIFHYDLVDVSSGKTLISDDINALHVEELDQVTKRVAASIVQLTPVEKTVEVGLVTEQETLEPNRRKANASWGIGFGYLYPQNGYDEEQDVFVWDFRSFYEMRKFALDALLGIRKGLALNVGFLYIPSPKDFSPFVGAGVGFHAVSHDIIYDYDYEYHYENQTEEPNDGFEFLVKGGLLAFRTYDFRVVATVEYSMTLNDFDDRAIVLTIGVMRSGKKVFGIF
jgi:TolB-like protein